MCTPSKPGGDGLCPLHWQVLDPKLSAIKNNEVVVGEELHVSLGEKVGNRHQRKEDTVTYSLFHVWLSSILGGLNLTTFI